MYDGRVAAAALITQDRSAAGMGTGGEIVAQLPGSAVPVPCGHLAYTQGCVQTEETPCCQVSTYPEPNQQGPLTYSSHTHPGESGRALVLSLCMH